MRAVIQRVSFASVKIDDNTKGQIGPGLLILLGIEDADNIEDVNWLTRKICGLRVFSDEYGKMNLDLCGINGELLVVSQFTLHASTKKGNRPSYMKAARPSHAEPMYEYFMEQLWHVSDLPVKGGKFGADMKVNLINDGPVTIWIDSKNKE